MRKRIYEKYVCENGEDKRIKNKDNAFSFYLALKKAGYTDVFFNAYYNWCVRNSKEQVEYVEGDVYIKNMLEVV